MLFRTVRSAALAACLLAADLALLTLYLNPEASLRRDGAGLLICIGVPYALAGTIALAAIVLLASAWGWPRAPRPPLPRLPWFASLSFVCVAVAASIYWLNLTSYRHSIPIVFVRALAAAAACLAGAALVLLAVLADTWLFPNRGRGLSAALAVLAPASALVLPLALLPRFVAQPTPVPVKTERVQPARRIVLVGLDGMSLGQIRDGVAQGSLPAFARLLKRGAQGPLATLRPTEGPPIWTTIFTGLLPRDHGIKSFATYHLRGSGTSFELLPKGALVGLLERVGLVSTAPVTASSRKRRALWNALNAFGIQTGIVRFWATYPPEKVQGFMLSNYFHRLHDDAAHAAETLYPPDLLAEVHGRAVDPTDVDRALVAQFVDLSGEPPRDEIGWRRDLVERALAPDMTYQRAGAVLRAAYDPPFFATYFYGLDVVGHAFTRFAKPELFGDVPPEEVRRYGRVVDHYAAYLSEWVGDLEKGLRPDEVLVVISGYGMEPAPPWRRLLSWLTGGSAASGTHDHAPDGFFVAVGDGIRPGAMLNKASVLDVAPTILYLMGLPVARDMEGRVLTEILDEDFARAHPLTFVPSYESLAVTPVAGAPDVELPLLPEETP